MFLSGCLETRYSPARDAGHPGVIGGSDKPHLQGMGAGVFENFMREGRGQQPFWPSSGINNVGTRVLSQGGMKRRQRSEKRDMGKEKEDKKGKDRVRIFMFRVRLLLPVTLVAVLPLAVYT